MFQPPLVALMRDSGHVPLCRVQLVCLRLSKGNHQRRLRSPIKAPWHMARFLSSFSYKTAMLPITFVQPASHLDSLTDDFDLSKHRRLLVVDTCGGWWVAARVWRMWNLFSHRIQYSTSLQAGRQGQVTYLDAGSVRPPRTNAPPM